MSDYPDHTRLFHLVGSDITLNINIEASDITLPVSIAAATATVDVNLEASDITLDVNIAASAVTIDVHITDAQVDVNIAASAVTVDVDVANISTSDSLNVAIQSAAVILDVNIESAGVTIDIKFTDQSVAVFDANQWFALQAQQVFISGSASVPNNGGAIICSRTVPAGRTFFITGFGFGVQSMTNAPLMVDGAIRVATVATAYFGSYRGGGIALHTPIRATAGQVVDIYMNQWQAGAAITGGASFWGYDKIG